jgi:polysaccharide biosynthesis transport protein
MPDLKFPHPSRVEESFPLETILSWQSIFQMILNRIWLIFIFIVVMLVLGVVYIKIAPRLYETVATVQVQQQDAKILNADQVVTEDLQEMDVLDTIVAKLSDPALLEKVLLTNNLIAPEDATAGGDTMAVRQEKIAAFASHVKVTLRRNTRLIDIAVTDKNPRLAAQLANSFVGVYWKQDADAQQAATEMATRYLEQQAQLQMENLTNAEEKLAADRNRIGLYSPEEGQDRNTRLLQNFDSLLTTSIVAVAQAEGSYQDWKNMTSTVTNMEDLLAYPDIANDPAVEKLEAAEEDSQSSFSQITNRYREKNPKHIAAESSLNDLKHSLESTIRSVRARNENSLGIDYTNKLTSKQRLEAQLHQAESNASQLDFATVRFNVQSEDVAARKAQYDSIISRLGETTAAQFITPERISFLRQASVPEKPASPRAKRIIMVMLFAGLACGIGLAIILEVANSSVDSVDEAERYLSLPALGAILRLRKAEAKKSCLTTADDNHSVRTEMFRTLRTNIQMLKLETPKRIYLFTSALEGEGKTFSACNYAASLARQGLRTLLIDMDLRRPMVEEFFTGASKQLPGVSDYFLGNKKLSEICVQGSGEKNLSWIPGGAPVPEPLELLARSNFQQLLNEGLANFDSIVIDTAPVLQVSDCLLIAGKAQIVLLVIKACKTPRKAVRRSVLLLEKAGAPVKGLVLNLLPNHILKKQYYYAHYK